MKTQAQFNFIAVCVILMFLSIAYAAIFPDYPDENHVYIYKSVLAQQQQDQNNHVALRNAQKSLSAPDTGPYSDAD
jgi:hypothetical protein